MIGYRKYSISLEGILVGNKLDKNEGLIYAKMWMNIENNAK